jgi:hypothetical protein
MEDLEAIREQNRWNPDKKEEVREKSKSSLPKSTIALMTITALFFDVLQLLLIFFAVGVVADTFITVFAGLTFFTWFKIHGVSFASPKRLMALGGGWLIELIPFLNILPTWTFAVWYTISTTKIAEVAERVPGGKVISVVAQTKSGKKAT